MEPKSCWIITEGIAGTENQCLGIAEALGIHTDIKRIGLREPWKSFSPYIGFEQGWSFTPPLVPPWPDLVIAGGRKSIAAARYIRKASKKTFIVFVQDPKIYTSVFDLVVAPRHDSIRGDNVFITEAAPNRITPKKLANAKEQFTHFESIASPRVAVLIGGDSKHHRLTTVVMEKLVDDLKKLKAGLMITASRRTNDSSRALLQGLKEKAYIWDGSGNNPYHGMLAWADYILVTEDSVSMASDAASTGKPVYIIPLEGGSRRLHKFHKNLMDKGITKPFDGKLESWSYIPLQDAQKAADEIRKRLSPR
ncbi:MAG: mitochondrial fission ELM1 family protein [Alphaproteobacteria bacterium]|nr:mitochondrial fission ELM1 family protein [Alphaproteobacteria bacterium]